MCNFENSIATFVMPHWRSENKLSRVHLDEAVRSVEEQTDSNWHLVIVDDCSPCEEAVEYLEQIRERLRDKITIIKSEQNCGPGIARNKGIEWAYRNHSPIILFLDADDVCHPRRLEVVRKHFAEDADVNVVYSTFEIIDENGMRVPYEKIAPAIREILDGHKKNVVEGENAWIQIGTEKNYTNLTSSTAVRTSIAYETPFPDVRVSEDAHTWMRYGAHKGRFVYDSSIPSLYRIPSTSQDASASRDRLDHFCEKKIEVDTDGFRQAMKLAVKNGNIRFEEEKELLARFYIKLAESMVYAGAENLKTDLLKRALSLSRKSAERLIEEKGLSDKEMTEPMEVLSLEDIEINRNRWHSLGMQEIAKGHVAVVLLAGGLGSRLGFNAPKGMLDIGINKHLYLFEIIVKKLKQTSDCAGRHIDLYIMVNEKNAEETRDFFKEHNFFGYKKEHIIFFPQNVYPKFLFDGDYVLNQNGKIDTAPGGNGMWMEALKQSSFDKKMKRDGIRWINLLSVDNPLYEIVDAAFLGALIEQDGQLGVQVVEKNNPHEKVGVICKKDGKPYVKEYYELTAEEQEAVNEQNQLKYRYGVILNYMFRFSSAEAIQAASLPVHMAVKKIPYMDEDGNMVIPREENGYIEERLALDMIPLFNRVMAYEVDRKKNFAPIKNRDGIDSVESARELLRVNGYDL